MRRKVNATRMELMRVRKRLALAERGHRLLKDKLEGLIRELTLRLEEYKELRLRVDEVWPRVLQRFILADADASSAATEAAVLQARPELRVASEVRRVMGVTALETKAEIRSDVRRYALSPTSPHLDRALAELRELLAALVRLAGLEETVRALCAEVQRTRRRANALEYVLIPDLREMRKFIADHLEEMARSDISRLMKVKEMLLEREQQAS